MISYKSFFAFLIVIVIGLILFSCKYSTDKALERLDRGICLVSSFGSSTSESGASTTINVVLTSQPKSDVNIQVSSDNIKEGVVSTSMLTFTSTNWNTTQIVTVTGVDDDVYDAAQTYNIQFPSVTSNDDYFSEITINSIQLSNLDNDSRLTALKNTNFTLLASGSCPAGYTSGVISIDTEDTNNDDRVCSDFCGDTVESHPGVLLKLCSTQTAGQSNLDVLKVHKFIALRNGDKCPTGYNQGKIKIDTEDSSNANSSSGNIGESFVTEQYVDLSVCESGNDPNLANLAGSFITIFKNGTCPKGSVEGWIKLDTEDDSNVDAVSGNIGDSNLSNENSRSIYLRMCSFIR